MQQQVPTRAFHVMAKPSGSDCNLNCDYCFYLEKQSLYHEKPVTHMDDDTLEAYVRHYIAASETQNEVAFTWQGGEPTLLGLEFYRRAVALQAKYGAGRRRRTPAMATGNPWTGGISRAARATASINHRRKRDSTVEIALGDQPGVDAEAEAPAKQPTSPANGRARSPWP